MKTIKIFVLAFIICSVGFLTQANADKAKIGNCTITGKFGEFKIKPAIAGQLTVLTELPFPGAWNGDTAETIVDGYEYCMAAEIAYRSGLKKVKVVATSFPSLVSGTNKNYDLALAVISITEARKKVVDFSVPYFRSDMGVMVRAGTKVNSTQDLTKLTVGVLEGTTGYNFAADTLHVANVKVFPNTAELDAALQARQIDVIMRDISIVLGTVAASNGRFEVAGRYNTGESYGAVYPNKSKNEATLNKIIKQILDDGTMKRILMTYLSPIDIETIPLLNAKAE